MQAIRKLLDISEHTLAVVCIVSFVAMFILGIATVVFRFVIQSSLAFPDELIRYLFVWLIFLGSAIAFRRNMHAAIGVLVAHLPATLKRASLIFATLISGFFFLVIMIYGIDLTLRVRPQISPALEVSMAWVYGAVPVGMAFLLVYAIELLVIQSRAPADELLTEGH